jgi:glycosyltransferase involved in cell wall biosynthesis
MDAMAKRRGEIRVLHVIARLNVGGPARILPHVLHDLRRSGVSVLLASGSVEPGEADMSDLAKRLGIPTATVPQMRRSLSPLSDLRAYRRVRSLIRSFRPDVVHTHTAKAGALGRRAAWAEGTDLIVHTYHGHVFDGYFDPIRTRLFLGIERRLASVTHRICVLSRQQKRELLERYRIGTEDRYAVIPPGVAPVERDGDRDGSESAPLPLGWEGRTVVGIVGRIVPVKNHGLFLDAARRILNSAPETRFLVVGDGPLRGALESRVRREGWSDAIRFLGWRRDLARLYEVMDIVILTSKNEGVPVSLLEAMEFGIPVVSTDVGGVADFVSHGAEGFLAPSGDAEGLSRSVLRLIEDPGLRRRMGNAGTIRVASGTGPEAQARALLDLYRGGLGIGLGGSPARVSADGEPAEA